MIRIFRALSNSDVIMNTFVKCIREYESINKDFKFSSVIVEGAKASFNVFPEVIMEIILFVASLM